MINQIKSLFSSFMNAEDKSEQTIVKRISPEEAINNKKKVLTSIHKNSNSDMNFLYLMNDFREKRKGFMTKDMDELIHIIKEESAKQEYLSRTISNITGKISKKEYKFVGTNPKKAKKVQEKFKEILKNSYYNENSFFKELLINFVKYSNNFTIPKFEDDKLSKVIIMQNIGWHVDKRIGTGYAETFNFEPGDGVKQSFRNQIDVWHYTFNKESDEIFAMPMWISVIPTLKKYSYLLSSTIDSYSDQSIERIIYEIGISKNGNIKPVKPQTHDSIANLLKNTDDDLIVDTPVNVNVVTKHFTSPDKILECLKQQIVAGLYTSENQLGISNTGRQDAETQNENTMITAEDFLNDLELQINQTFIRRICIDLFGNYSGENEVELKFEDNFNLRERKEKHAVYLFQAGIIDLDETRKLCSLENEINSKKTFHTLYGKNEISGSVESTNNPKNQHAPGGTGTTKKTKKDIKKR